MTTSAKKARTWADRVAVAFARKLACDVLAGAPMAAAIAADRGLAKAWAAAERACPDVDWSPGGDADRYVARRADEIRNSRLMRGPSVDY